MNVSSVLAASAVVSIAPFEIGVSVGAFLLLIYLFYYLHYWHFNKILAMQVTKLLASRYERTAIRESPIR